MVSGLTFRHFPQRKCIRCTVSYTVMHSLFMQQEFTAVSFDPSQGTRIDAGFRLEGAVVDSRLEGCKRRPIGRTRHDSELLLGAHCVHGKKRRERVSQK